MNLTHLWAHDPSTNEAFTGLLVHTAAPDDVEVLRAAGFDDRQIFALTTYGGLRLAFATVNASAGATPTPSCATTPRPRSRRR